MNDKDVLGEIYTEEDVCRICMHKRGIRVIIFDSFVRGKCSSYLCEQCMEKIQK